jgi:hypothetical protein
MLFLILITYLAMMIFCRYRIAIDNRESLIAEIVYQIRDKVISTFGLSFKNLGTSAVGTTKAIFEYKAGWHTGGMIDHRPYITP